jgi:hypothetical protein
VEGGLDGLFIGLWLVPMITAAWALVITTTARESGATEAGLTSGTSMRTQLVADSVAGLVLTLRAAPLAGLAGCLVGIGDALRQGSAVTGFYAPSLGSPPAGYCLALVCAMLWSTAAAVVCRRRATAISLTLMSVVLFLMLTQMTAGSRFLRFIPASCPWAPLWSWAHLGGASFALHLTPLSAALNVAFWTIASTAALARGTTARGPSRTERTHNGVRTLFNRGSAPGTARPVLPSGPARERSSSTGRAHTVPVGATGRDS